MSTQRALVASGAASLRAAPPQPSVNARLAPASLVQTQPTGLSPEDEQARAAALAEVRAERAHWRIGDTRPADNPCPACHQERLERLEEIAAKGGQTWVLFCRTAGCPRRRNPNQ